VLGVVIFVVEEEEVEVLRSSVSTIRFDPCYVRSRDETGILILPGGPISRLSHDKTVYECITSDVYSSHLVSISFRLKNWMAPFENVV